MENIDETNLPLPFVKPFGLTSGASVRGMFVKPFGLTSGASVRGTLGLILLKKSFNCFNFYSIDRFGQQTEPPRSLSMPRNYHVNQIKKKN